MPDQVSDQVSGEISSKAKELAGKLIRNFNTAELAEEKREPLYESRGARLAAGTAATKIGLSVDILPPGKRSCPYHFHHVQEEVFIVVEGEGSLRVAGEMLPVKTGDVIFIPPGPDYPHQMINTSSAPLKYLSLGTRESPEIVEYPDSGKYLVTAKHFDLLQRSGPDGSLEYWDGEP